MVAARTAIAVGGPPAVTAQATAAAAAKAAAFTQVEPANVASVVAKALFSLGAPSMIALRSAGEAAAAVACKQAIKKGQTPYQVGKAAAQAAKSAGATAEEAAEQAGKAAALALTGRSASVSSTDAARAAADAVAAAGGSSQLVSRAAGVAAGAAAISSGKKGNELIDEAVKATRLAGGLFEDLAAVASDFASKGAIGDAQSAPRRAAQSAVMALRKHKNLPGSLAVAAGVTAGKVVQAFGQSPSQAGAAASDAARVAGGTRVEITRAAGFAAESSAKSAGYELADARKVALVAEKVAWMSTQPTQPDTSQVPSISGSLRVSVDEPSAFVSDPRTAPAIRTSLAAALGMPEDTIAVTSVTCQSGCGPGSALFEIGAQPEELEPSPARVAAKKNRALMRVEVVGPGRETSLGSAHSASVDRSFSISPSGATLDTAASPRQVPEEGGGLYPIVSTPSPTPTRGPPQGPLAVTISGFGQAYGYDYSVFNGIYVEKPEILLGGYKTFWKRDGYLYYCRDFAVWSVASSSSWEENKAGACTSGAAAERGVTAVENLDFRTVWNGSAWRPVSGAKVVAVGQAPTNCSGWAPSDGTFKGKGYRCEHWGATTPWCFVDESYSGPGKEFVQESSAYKGKFYVPCKRSVNPRIVQWIAAQHADQSCTSVCNVSSMVCTTRSERRMKDASSSKVAFEAAVGEEIQIICPDGITFSDTLDLSPLIREGSRVCELGREDRNFPSCGGRHTEAKRVCACEPLEAQGDFDKETDAIARAANRFARAKFLTSISNVTDEPEARPSTTTCSGWVPDDGAYKGQGGSCARWGWSTEWCYVDQGYTGIGKEFTQRSIAYPGKYFVPCSGMQRNSTPAKPIVKVVAFQPQEKWNVSPIVGTPSNSFMRVPIERIGAASYPNPYSPSPTGLNAASRQNPYAPVRTERPTLAPLPLRSETAANAVTTTFDFPRVGSSGQRNWITEPVSTNGTFVAAMPLRPLPSPNALAPNALHLFHHKGRQLPLCLNVHCLHRTRLHLFHHKGRQLPLCRTHSRRPCLHLFHHKGRQLQPCLFVHSMHQTCLRRQSPLIFRLQVPRLTEIWNARCKVLEPPQQLKPIRCPARSDPRQNKWMQKLRLWTRSGDSKGGG
eukprot:TRINITY_DN5668_c0_g2_i1.p1 TRINITY_DN5668_c0_g2~~TRINITY_DN5668_c0_g2_i1.p1  ORF type:complete len:1140 (+),score=179.36 TRINITY_DN5668_c0_g2_i1:45-3422(+)